MTAPGRMVVGLVGLLSLSVAGCATGPAKDAATTAQRFLQLTASEHPGAAYALLGESFSSRCDRPCFARLAAAQREDARRSVADLRAGSEPRVDYAIDLNLNDGTTLHLGQADAGDAVPPAAPAAKRPTAPARPPGYLFSHNPLDFYPQSTPEEALRSFARALAAGRYQVLLRFVPKALAEQLTVEQLRARFEGPARAGVQAQLAAVQRHVGEPFQLDGTTARLPLGEGQEVRLVLEQGRWRVAQLQ